MTINGNLLIAGSEKRGTGGDFQGVEASTGTPLPVSFGGRHPGTSSKIRYCPH